MICALLVQYYFEPPDYWQALEFDTEVNLQILERFKQAGIEFAFPTQTTVFATEPLRPAYIQWGEAAPKSAGATGED